MCNFYVNDILDICQHNPSSISAIVIQFNEGHIDQHFCMGTRCVFELVMVGDCVWSLSDANFTRSDVYNNDN